MLSHLKTEREVVQIWIVDSLRKIGDTTASKALLELLQATKSANLRYMIIRAIGELGDMSTVEALLPYLSDDDRHVQKDTQEALRKLGHIISDE